MLAHELKRLSNAADTARVDLTDGALTLAPVHGGLLAWYPTGYSACGIRVATDRQELEAPVSIAAEEFKALIATLDDDAPVALKIDTSALMITARRRRISLQFKNKPDWAGYEALEKETFVASVDLAEFTREATFAASTSASTMTTPILTAVRIIVASNMIGMQSANGSSLVFETGMLAQSSQRLEMFAPAQDLLLALRQLRGNTLHLAMSGKAMLLRGEDAIAKLPTVSGKWPVMSQLKTLDFGEQLTLPASSIKALAVAARAYKASNDVTIRPAESGEHVVLETAPDQKGQFQDVIDGRITKPYTFDVADLETAAKISDGEVQMSFSNAMALVMSGNRKLYTVTRVRV